MSIKSRALALAGAIGLPVASCFAEGSGNTYAPDMTNAGAAITEISQTIVTFVEGTVTGKVIAVVFAWGVLWLLVRLIRWLLRGK